MSDGARVRLLPALAGAMTGGMVAGRPETALGCLALLLGAAVWLRAGWPPRGYLLGSAAGAAVAFLLNLYLGPGEPLRGWSLLGRAPTVEGARNGALLALRMAVALCGAWVMVRAVPAERALDAVVSWLRGLGLGGAALDRLRSTLGLGLRFAPLLAAERRRIARLAELRVGVPRRGLAGRLRQGRMLWVPSVACALERAERTALALEARHYRMRGARAEGSPIPWAWAALGGALFGWGLLWRS